MAEHPVLTLLRQNTRMATLTTGLVNSKDGYRCVGCGEVLVTHNDSRPPAEQIAAADEHKCKEQP